MHAKQLSTYLRIYVIQINKKLNKVSQIRNQKNLEKGIMDKPLHGYQQEHIGKVASVTHQL